MSSITYSAQLATASPIVSLCTTTLSLIHFLASRKYRGHYSGAAISLSVVLPVKTSALFLVLSALTQAIIFILRLLSNASSVASSDLLVIALAMFALHYSGHLACDRRRRHVAALLASVPMFGDGTHSPTHTPFPDTEILFSDALRVPPEKRHSMPITQIRSFDNDPDAFESSSSAGDIQRGRLVPRETGIVKRRIWEIPCRTANTWVFGRSERQGWPINVVRTIRTKGKRFILIKDVTIQDGAGASLLHPSFTHELSPEREQIALVAYQSVDRSALCSLVTWHRKFNGRVFERFARIPAVSMMLQSDLRKRVLAHSLAQSAPSDNRRHSDIEDPPSSEDDNHHVLSNCYVREVAWAVITVEVLDFLQRKRNDTPFLTWLVDLPHWLCQFEDDALDDVINRLFDQWMEGRTCGSFGLLFGSRPCDSECCCHLVSGTGCGCQCPCVCTCI